MITLWSRYYVYVFQGCSSRLDTPNHHPRLITIPQEVSKNGSARILSALAIFWWSNVFLTKTNHHERILQYWAF